MAHENEAALKIKNCIDCPFHEVFNDPDPDDWFCDDDMGVKCKKAQRNVTTACRPHHLREESKTPDWCPLLAENEKND